MPPDAVGGVLRKFGPSAMEKSGKCRAVICISNSFVPSPTTTTSPSSLSFVVSSPSPTMMLLRQLPTGSMALSSMSFPSFAHSLPSNSAVLMSLLVSFILLFFVRLASVCLTNYLGTLHRKQAPIQVEEKAADSLEGRQQPSSWARGLLRWDKFPSLPVSLTLPPTETNGKGVGMHGKRLPLHPQPWQAVRGRRGGPMFETPLPALYQSQEPLSMAKIIMSRHTYRRPSSRPPARSTPTSTRVSVSPPPPSSSSPSPSTTTPSPPSNV